MADPPLTADKLRQDFPEFASLSAYPNGLVNFWIGVGVLLISDRRWRTLYPAALELFTAHNLALQRQAQRVAEKGGAPGMARGAISAESVGPVSASYDTSASMELDAGHWNLTTYGQRYIHLARMIGSGPVQVMGDVRSPIGSGPAWPGPFYWAGD